jgi:hypothetical protein
MVPGRYAPSPGPAGRRVRGLKSQISAATRRPLTGDDLASESATKISEFSAARQDVRHRLSGRHARGEYSEGGS